MSPLLRDPENCLVLPVFQGSRLVRKDIEVLLTDSNLTKTYLTDSLSLIHRKVDGSCYFNSPFISKVLVYSNFAQLLAEQLSKKLHFFILLRYYSFKKPKCFCSKQNTNANPKYRSGEAKNDPLEQFVCLQSLNIRIDMTQCVTSAWAKPQYFYSLVFVIITKCRREN